MSEMRSVRLPPEQAKYIDSLVEAGTFASANDVIDAGLQALRDRDAEVETWLRDAVVPVYDAMRADPGRGVPLEEVRDRLRAKHLRRLEDQAKGSDAK